MDILEKPVASHRLTVLFIGFGILRCYLYKFPALLYEMVF